jgi:hypothetical protein
VKITVTIAPFVFEGDEHVFDDAVELAQDLMNLLSRSERLPGFTFDFRFGEGAAINVAAQPEEPRGY